MKRFEWACNANGFGIGIWRNVWYPPMEIIWTVSLGPFTFYFCWSIIK